MDERREKRIETAIAWLGYSVVFLGLIVLLLGLMRVGGQTCRFNQHTPTIASVIPSSRKGFRS
jgi:hypothetical protein